ncbi:ThiF family adenylyltransferase [Corallococcus sp. M34]|uniref:HesA/MoeB/ThiF family protein n=1 Tax=Citreicoccus inhibens TaxID=2849499 RepID=UPI001C24C4D1|nr:ThiF family adenylyltransferase [Citreicoccus inhibens]MBU8900964.1 ThiF family adenylyltransferase [Citreicoccus inhibens]
MTSTPLLPPLKIERGLRGLRGIDACLVEDGPKFDERTKRWVVTLSLHRDVGARFVGTSTRWCVLIDGDYPFGPISFYPAAEGGLTATFPHQRRNTAGRERRGWRSGKLCLDSPFGGERRVTVVRDPVGDVDARLRWHVERAMAWLQHAANDQLLAEGEPFELPDRPHTTVREWERHLVVDDETATSFAAWSGRERTFGRARFGAVTDIGGALGVSRFEDQSGTTIRTWAGRELGDLGKGDVNGFWWLLPNPIVLPPWQAPGTWGELRRIAKAMGLDTDAMLRWLFPSIRGAKPSSVLLIGYPVPLRVGAAPSEVHWDALLLPRLNEASGKPPSGFRPNARGWWHRDRYGKFADNVSLEYLYAENWSPQRLHARGRLPTAVRDLRVALLGVGALGSLLAEMLVRAGVTDVALVDDDHVEAGNVCRHVATLVDIRKDKVQVVGQRLRQISPDVRVVEVSKAFCGDVKTIVEQLDPYDVVLDCTASDEVVTLLATGWWSNPRVFASFSLGYGGKRLFSFGVSGHEFPQQEFTLKLRPWIEHEAATWATSEEVLEGAGCWSPLFPARHDDVVLAAATCVKELETLVAQRPRAPRFRVFAQSGSDDGFQGFVPEAIPPSVDAKAS